MEIIAQNGCGVDAAEIIKKTRADRATVYRQLEKLARTGEVQEVMTGDGKKRYERPGHHHHVICRSCGRMEKIDAQKAEFALGMVEKRVAGMVKFTQVEHNLEFFGLCPPCKAHHD